MDYAILSVPNQAGTMQVVSLSTTSAQTAVLKAMDTLVVSTNICFVVRGTNPTATNTCMAIPPNWPVILKGIQEGEKLAFVLPTGTGTAYVHQGQ